jgi:putative ABC transport system ATP-binding protein
MSAQMVACEGLVHIYKSRDVEVVALQGLDLAVAPGEVVAIVGRSGSGKTTLMNILAGAETPSAGAAVVAGHDLTRMGEQERDAYRHDVVGYVLQRSQSNLAPDLSAIENVMLPIRGGASEQRRRRARELMDAMAVVALAERRPAELSGGEAQRLAVAVAMANEPRLLLADEPTAELDEVAASRLLADLRSLLRARGTTAVLVTHDRNVEQHANRVIQIRDGRTSTETRWRAGEDGLISDEVLILDRAGRLQLPKSFVEKLHLRGRVRAHIDGDEVRLRRVDDGEESR